jgi:hypothetical protein
MQIFLRFWNWLCNFGVQRPLRDAGFNQEEYAREEHQLVAAQQLAYESVVRDFDTIPVAFNQEAYSVVPDASEEAIPVPDRQLARIEYYKQQIAIPEPERSFTLSGYADCARCDVIISGPSTTNKQFLDTVVSDDEGNYSISGLTNGTFRIRPFKKGKLFKPAFMDVTVNGDTQAPPFIDPSSVVDSRMHPSGPNSSRNLNGTLIYDVQVSSNSKVPGIDSRVSKPVGCGSPPQNSRK